MGGSDEDDWEAIIWVDEYCRVLIQIYTHTFISSSSEKENLNNQLTDCQAKLLKFSNKEKQWHKDMDLVVESEKSMKEKFEEMERNL